VRILDFFCCCPDCVSLGMTCVWESERGFGERSWRYSAVINNGVIEKLFVEVCSSRGVDMLLNFLFFLLRAGVLLKTAHRILSTYPMQTQCWNT
jgi:hypothetical protein